MLGLSLGVLAGVDVSGGSRGQRDEEDSLGMFETERYCWYCRPAMFGMSLSLWYVLLL